LGEIDVIDHKSQGEGTRQGNIGREQSCKKIDQGDRQNTKDERNDAKVPFGFCERIEQVGENEEQGGVKESRVFTIKFQLSLQIIPRIIEGINFVDPE
jgi:hypothetical protein